MGVLTRECSDLRLALEGVRLVLQDALDRAWRGGEALSCEYRRGDLVRLRGGEVLPCPFCGGERLRCKIDESGGGYTGVVSCKACGGSIVGGACVDEVGARRSVLGMWNRRWCIPEAECDSSYDSRGRDEG